VVGVFREGEMSQTLLLISATPQLNPIREKLFFQSYFKQIDNLKHLQPFFQLFALSFPTNLHLNSKKKFSFLMRASNAPNAKYNLHNVRIERGTEGEWRTEKKKRFKECEAREVAVIMENTCSSMT
jgi:hypothetical protein